MNPELQAKLVHYLDVLEKGAKKAGDFAEAEIPQLVREWLLWLAIERFCTAAAFAVMATLAVVLGRKLMQTAREEDPRNETPAALFSWFLTVLAVGGFGFGMFHYALQGVKVIVAPRVVVVEQLAGMVQGMKK